MLLQVSVIVGGACMVARGHVWLPGACMVARLGGVCGCQGGVHGCQGACMVAEGACMVAVGGMCGCQGVCVVAGGMCGCQGGMRGCEGCAWLWGACGGVCIGYDEIWSMTGWYASYWNAFLFEFAFIENGNGFRNNYVNSMLLK